MPRCTGARWRLSGSARLNSPASGTLEVMCRWYYCCYHRCMTTRKQRLTVTVDPELVEAGTQRWPRVKPSH